MSRGLRWDERYRKREIRMRVARRTKCPACGMMVSGQDSSHGYLFGPMCYEKPRRGPWKYDDGTAYFGGTWIRPDTLPDDIREELTKLRREAGEHRRETWSRMNGGTIVARWDDEGERG